MKVNIGDTIKFEQSNESKFPTGELVRMAVIEEVSDDEIIVRQLEDGFTKRISEDQIVELD